VLQSNTMVWILVFLVVHVQCKMMDLSGADSQWVQVAFRSWIIKGMGKGYPLHISPPQLTKMSGEGYKFPQWGGAQPKLNFVKSKCHRSCLVAFHAFH